MLFLGNSETNSQLRTGRAFVTRCHRMRRRGTIMAPAIAPRRILVTLSTTSFLLTCGVASNTLLSLLPDAAHDEVGGQVDDERDQEKKESDDEERLVVI